jgi:hypothetical protein
MGGRISVHRGACAELRRVAPVASERALLLFISSTCPVSTPESGGGARFTGPVIDTKSICSGIFSTHTLDVSRVRPVQPLSAWIRDHDENKEYLLRDIGQSNRIESRSCCS